MVTINNATLAQNVYETVYDALKAEEGSYGASSSVTLTAAYIDDEEALPQVVISSPEVDESDYTFDRTADNSLKEIQVIVDVYTKKSKDLDIIFDKVRHTISTTKFTGLMLYEVNTGTSYPTVRDIKLKNKTINFSYKRR